MNRIFGILAAIMFLVSCQDINRTSKPDDLIPEDRMVDVLTELSLLHGARSYNKTLMEEKGIDPYPYLVEKFGIDSTQLAESNEYYAQNYKQYQRIYDRVKLRLEALVEEYDSIRENEEMRRDSLMKIPRNDSLSRENLRRRKDSLVPLRIQEELPAPVSRTQMQ